MQVAIALHHAAMLSGASPRGCLFGVVVPVTLSGGASLAASATALDAADMIPAAVRLSLGTRAAVAGPASSVAAQAATAAAVAALRATASAEEGRAASFGVWAAALTAAISALPAVPVVGSAEDAEWSVLRPVAVAAAAGAAGSVVRQSGGPEGSYALTRSGADTGPLEALLRGKGVTAAAAGRDEHCAVLCSTFSRPAGGAGQSIVVWARLAPTTAAST
jgi:hypothetical protein